MSEKRKISGVRTDISISEFEAGLEKMKLPKPKKPSKFKKFLGKAADTLSALGFMPVLTGDTKSKVYKGDTQPYHEPNNFRESYRVDPPPRRTMEDYVIEKMAAEAYLKMVDGKGDPEPHGGHDR